MKQARLTWEDVSRKHEWVPCSHDHDGLDGLGSKIILGMLLRERIGGSTVRISPTEDSSES